MKNSYAPPESMRSGLMSGDVAVPTNDAEAKALIQKSKQGWDENGDGHPDIPNHKEAVTKALMAWHKAAPSEFSAKVMTALRDDPNLKG